DEDQLARGKVRESGLDGETRARGQSSQQPIRELATYGSANLRNLLAGAKPIKTRRQRTQQRRRNGERWWQINGDVLITSILERSDSSTVFVSSSANKGMPSALLIICSWSWLGSSLLPATSRMMALVCSDANRLRVNRVTCDSSSQGGKNSGLKLTKTKTLAVLIDAMHRLSSSSELQSIQCTSASTMTTGRVSARPRTCRSSAAIVRSFCRCGVKSGDE